MNVYQYSEEEIERLNRQAFLGFQAEKHIYNKVIHPGMNIVDLGSGSGLFTKIMAENFKDSFFSGIENEESLLKIADQFKVDNLNFRRGNITLSNQMPDEEVNLFNLRFVAQHLSHIQLNNLFENMRNSLRQNGRAVVTDIDAGGLRMYPENRELTDTYIQALKYHSDLGGDRDVILKISDMAEESGFKVESVTPFNVNTNLIGNSSFFSLFFSFIPSILKSSLEMDRWENLQKWFESECSFAYCTYFSIVLIVS